MSSAIAYCSISILAWDCPRILILIINDNPVSFYPFCTTLALLGVDPSSSTGGLPSNVTVVHANPSGADTRGGETFWVVGTNLGPGGTCAGITLSYGPPGAAGMYPVTPTVCNASFIKFSSLVGFGAGHVLSLSVGGLVVVSSAPALLSYGTPIVTGMAVQSGSSYALSNLPTTGATLLFVTGSNFGSANTNLTLTLSSGYSSDPSLAAYAWGPCTLITPHTAMACMLPPGVGTNLYVSAALGGRQGLSAPLSTVSLSYAPPVITGISGPGALLASTAGGQVRTQS